MSTQVKDANGNVINTPAWDPAYGASATAITYVTAKYGHMLIAPTSGVARLKRVEITLAGLTTAGDVIVQLTKNSALGTGTLVGHAATPLNSTSAAATCVCDSSVSGTPGAIVGTAIRTARLTTAGAAGAGQASTVVFDFSRNMDQAPVLQGAAVPAENFEILFTAGTTAPTGAVTDCAWEWEEAAN